MTDAASGRIDQQANRNEQIGRRDRLRKARNYVIYYGHGRADVLSRYDLAIVEPAGQTEQSLSELHAAGTLVAAYVSITELPSYDPYKLLLQPKDFLTVNGRVIENSAYQTQMADLRSQSWTNLLLHRIGGYLRIAGYDGLFLDTISNVEWSVLPPGVRADQQDAALALLKRLRTLFPEHLFIQNNGLESLCELTAPYIDGICWENPDFVRPETYKWHEKARQRLKRIAAEHGLKVMLLLEEGSTTDPGYEAAVYLAEKENYLLYKSTNHYLDVGE